MGFLLVFLYSEHHGTPSHTHYWHLFCSFTPNEFKAEFFRKERVSGMIASYDHMYNVLCHFRLILNEIMSFATTWMDSGDDHPKRNKSDEKDKYHISFIRGSYFFFK